MKEYQRKVLAPMNIDVRLRMFIEYIELEQRIDRLDSFIKNHSDIDSGCHRMSLLKEQLEDMREYEFDLERRAIDDGFNLDDALTLVHRYLSGLRKEELTNDI